MITVLGASGLIGGSIFIDLQNEGVEARGTYCSHRKEGLEYLNLEDALPRDSSLFNKGATCVIISAAFESTIDGSKKNWEKARRINAGGVKAVLDRCFQNRILPLFISTDNVFDGEKGGYQEGDQRNPVNCYGRIKREVEDYLLGSGAEFIIVRVGRVFGAGTGDNTFVASLIRDLRAGKEVPCSDDQVFTPIYIADLVDAIKLLIRKGSRGVYHLSSVRPITRLAAAEEIRDFFSIKNTRIRPCKINSLNLLEKRPLLIGLDCRKFNALSGFEQKDLRDYLGLISR